MNDTTTILSYVIGRLEELAVTIDEGTDYLDGVNAWTSTMPLNSAKTVEDRATARESLRDARSSLSEAFLQLYATIDEVRHLKRVIEEDQ